MQVNSLSIQSIMTAVWNANPRSVTTINQQITTVFQNNIVIATSAVIDLKPWVGGALREVTIAGNHTTPNFTVGMWNGTAGPGVTAQTSFLECVSGNAGCRPFIQNTSGTVTAVVSYGGTDWS